MEKAVRNSFSFWRGEGTKYDWRKILHQCFNICTDFFLSSKNKWWHHIYPAFWHCRMLLLLHSVPRKPTFCENECCKSCSFADALCKGSETMDPWMNPRWHLSIFRMKMVVGYLTKICVLRWTLSCLKATIPQPVGSPGCCIALQQIRNISRNAGRRSRPFWGNVTPSTGECAFLLDSSPQYREFRRTHPFSQGCAKQSRGTVGG